jgi:nucleoside 2-deoxyribosyltransferase
MKIYLAGPDVFLPDAVEIGRRKIGICRSRGLTGLWRRPWRCRAKGLTTSGTT